MSESTISSRIYIKDLPFEILQTICEDLEYHLPSLQAFGLVNKLCHAAAASVLLRKIVLRLSTSSWLQKDVCAIKSRLSSIGPETVRRLDVRGALEKPVHHELPGPANSRPGPMGICDLHVTNEDWLWKCEDDELEVFDTSLEPGSPNNLEGFTVENDPAWQPLVQLIAELPALSDLVWSCLNHRPFDALAVLSEHRPNCKLHLRTFRMDPGMDDYLSELLKSSNLYSIWGRSARTGGWWGPKASDVVSTFWEEIIRRAPNLKEVRPWNLTHCMQPLPYGTAASSRHRPLGRLDFTSFDRPPKGTLEEWSQRIDFSALLTIRIVHLEPDGLYWMQMHAQLNSLRTLIVSQKRSLATPRDLNPFLASLRPLQAIRLPCLQMWEAPPMFHTVLQQHGFSLRRLWVDSPASTYDLRFDQALVEELHSHCPLLEDLKVPLSRTQGDKTEILVYKALGSICTLRTLSLIMDCRIAGPRAFSPSSTKSTRREAMELRRTGFDEFSCRLYTKVRHPTRPSETWIRYGHIRDALVNAAVDDTLAAAVWDAVNKARPARSHLLERITLQIMNCGQIGGIAKRSFPELRDCFDLMRRTWLVEPNPRDDMVGSVHVKSTTPWCAFGPQPELQQDLRAIIGRLWPVTTDSSVDWRTLWHSFPLSEE